MLVYRLLWMSLMKRPQLQSLIRRKTVWGPTGVFLALTVALLGLAPNAAAAGKSKASADQTSRHLKPAPVAPTDGPSRRVKNYKIDDEVSQRQHGHPLHTSKVIVTLQPGATLPKDLRRYLRNQNLVMKDGVALELPNGLIKQLAAMPEVFRIHDDRPIELENYRTSVTVGAAAVRALNGYKGDGIGIAVIDSGIAPWHDDLTRGAVTKTYPYGNQRVAKFVDFVNGRSQPYDDNGHGTHIAGIMAGNGYDSNSEKMGIAPNASLVSLKVLDANGQGTISNIIAALDWVAANYQTYNIRVVNLSVGARVRESYWTDPLTLAAKRLTDLGITVVSAAGNSGKNALGQLQYGGIVAPANAPWVLTVGASSTEGTLTRKDDTLAGYSSSGPTAFDFLAKPDLVAPGTGTVSLAAPGSTLATTQRDQPDCGQAAAGEQAVSGAERDEHGGAGGDRNGRADAAGESDADAEPDQSDSAVHGGAVSRLHPLRQGAGFLNTLGAVRLAKFYAGTKAGDKMPTQKVWSGNIIWGNQLLTGGYLNPKANAWKTGVVWGAARALNGVDNIVWGTNCADCDNIVWGTRDADNIVWGTKLVGDNIVWGTRLLGDNIVWGTLALDNIVWGTDCGGADCDNIVWGTVDLDNIVWGTAEPARQHRVGHRHARQHRVGHGGRLGDSGALRRRDRGTGAGSED